MSAVRFALFAGSLAGLFAVSHPALGAADSAALCADVAGPKAMVGEHHGLFAEQWQFLRGVYAMNPEPRPVCPTAITPRWRGSTTWAAASLSFHRRRQSLHAVERAARAPVAHEGRRATPSNTKAPKGALIRDGNRAPRASQRIGSETQLSRWSRHRRKDDNRKEKP
jgi:hypothetical protein